MPPTAPEQFAPSAVNNRTTAVLLDLDGTLVDTAPDIHEDIYKVAVAVQKELGLPISKSSEIKSFFEDDTALFIKRLLTGHWGEEPDSDLFAEAESLMKRHYGRLYSDLHVYEGVSDTLGALRAQRVKLACVTNKRQIFTGPLLSVCGLCGYFDTVVTGDSLPHKKPHPLPLLTAVKTLGGSPENALMVGDSDDDAKAARAANIRFVAASYGHNRNSPAADRVIERFPDLLGCL